MDGQSFHAQLHVVIDDGSQNRLLHQQLSGLGLNAHLLPESADWQEPCGNSPACGTTRVLAGDRPAAQTRGLAGGPNTGTDKQSDQRDFSRERTGMILDTNIHPSPRVRLRRLGTAAAELQHRLEPLRVSARRARRLALLS